MRGPLHIQVPIADDAVQQPGHSVAELLSRSQRQFVARHPRKSPGSVILGQSLFEPCIAQVVQVDVLLRIQHGNLLQVLGNCKRSLHRQAV